MVNQSHCSKCNNRGYLIERQGPYEIVSGFCDCVVGQELSKKYWTDKYLEANIYEEFHPLEIKDLVPQADPKHNRFVRYIQDYVNGLSKDSRSLLISGSTGTGKTLAGMLILKNALRKGFSAYYITWPDLLDQFIDSKPMRPFEVDFLAVDKLGADSIREDSKYPDVTLDRILSFRTSRKKPTILISAEPAVELAVKFTALKNAKAKFDILEVSGKNWYLIQAEKKLKGV